MFPEGRLFDFLIVGAVALVVVGPKDLPVLMRKVGQVMAKVRGMAAEFRASFEDLARQSELDELRREVQALRTARPMDFAETYLGAEGVMSGIRADLAESNAAQTAPEAQAAPEVGPQPGEPAPGSPAPSNPAPSNPAPAGPSAEPSAVAEPHAGHAGSEDGPKAPAS